MVDIMQSIIKELEEKRLKAVEDQKRPFEEETTRYFNLGIEHTCEDLITFIEKYGG